MRTWTVTLIVAATLISTTSICSANESGSRYRSRSADRGGYADRDRFVDKGRTAFRARHGSREHFVTAVDGSWLEACDGEPKEYGRCNVDDAHVRCFKLENKSAQSMECGISMKASMRSPTGYNRLYTANEHTLMYAGDSDWLCFGYDEILESTGGNPWQWSIDEVYEPEIACRESDKL